MSDNFSNAFDRHREAQILRMAKGSTPAQRLEWLEEMLLMLSATGKSYYERKTIFREIIPDQK